MKSKMTAIAGMLVAFSMNAFAQSSADATATATIITPISISKTVDLNFGNVAVGASTGTVVLTPAGDRSATGGVSLPATGGSISAASFSVAGEGTYTYSITLPGSVTITRNSGSETMTVNTFTSTPSTTGALTAGAQTLTVGATLNVGASQVPGTYVSGTAFTVTVNYN